MGVPRALGGTSLVTVATLTVVCVAWIVGVVRTIGVGVGVEIIVSLVEAGVGALEALACQKDKELKSKPRKVPMNKRSLTTLHTHVASHVAHHRIHATHGVHRHPTHGVHAHAHHTGATHVSSAATTHTIRTTAHSIAHHVTAAVVVSVILHAHRTSWERAGAHHVRSEVVHVVSEATATIVVVIHCAHTTVIVIATTAEVVIHIVVEVSTASGIKATSTTAIVTHGSIFWQGSEWVRGRAGVSARKLKGGIVINAVLGCGGCLWGSKLDEGLSVFQSFSPKSCIFV